MAHPKFQPPTLIERQARLLAATFHATLVDAPIPTRSHCRRRFHQLLFGELCELLETTEDFVKIKSVYDNYEGWCHAAQLNHFEYSEPAQIILAGEWGNQISINSHSAMIPFGSSLSFLHGSKASVGNLNIEYDGAFILPKENKWNGERQMES